MEGYKPKEEKLILPVDPLKFEKRRILNQDEVNNLKEKYKIKNGEKVIVGGSLHCDELDYLENPLKSFINENSSSKIILVPRNINRFFEEWLGSKGIDFQTDLNEITGDKKYLVINSSGFLDRLYSIADVVLIGKTFFKPEIMNGQGLMKGQNPLEPAFYGKKIISGSDYGSWNKVAYDGLKKSGLITQVKNSNELERELLKGVSEKEFGKCQEKANKFIESQQGVGNVYAEIIQKILYGKLSKTGKSFLSEIKSFKKRKDYFKK